MQDTPGAGFLVERAGSAGSESEVGWRVVPRGEHPVSPADFQAGVLPEGVLRLAAGQAASGPIYFQFVDEAETPFPGYFGLLNDGITEGIETFEIELFDPKTHVAIPASIQGDAVFNVHDEFGFIAPKPGTLRFGTDGSDILAGGDGPDLIFGKGGDDTLDGRDGDDEIDGGAGDDTLDGGAGDDTLSGGFGFDAINGGAGTDTADYTFYDGRTTIELVAGKADFPGNNPLGQIETLSGIENVRTGAGNDTIIGDAGSNMLDGGAGDDTLDGGAGDDTLSGGFGFDAINGGAGIDTADYAFYDGRTTIDLVAGKADFPGNNPLGLIETLSGIENVRTGAGNDIIIGDAGSNMLEGGAGDDTLNGSFGFDVLGGGTGDDKLDGGADDDMLNGGFGLDALDGGAGIDTASYRTSSEAVTVSLVPGDPANARGDAEGDTLANIENLEGSNNAEQQDRLFGDDGPNVISGLDGPDALFGRPGNDTLSGGAGGDQLFGEAGDDTLIGGADADTFAYGRRAAGDFESNRDTITDFRPFVAGLPEHDEIDLFGDALVRLDGKTPIFGSARTTIDSNGDDLVNADDVRHGPGFFGGVTPVASPSGGGAFGPGASPAVFSPVSIKDGNLTIDLGGENTLTVLGVTELHVDQDIFFK